MPNSVILAARRQCSQPTNTEGSPSDCSLIFHASTKQSEDNTSAQQHALDAKQESKTRVFFLGALLFLGTTALYLPGRSHEFINYDDDDYVLSNSHVNSGLHWGTIRWALTSSDQANWHPVTWLSHGLDPAGHHTTNIVLHACNALLLFLVLRLASGATFRSFAVCVCDSSVQCWHGGLGSRA